MPTIKFEIAFSTREYELLIAAKSEKPHPDRIRALLISEARSTLRRMIDMVDQERNASFATKPVREHERKRVRVQNEGYYGLDSKALDKQHARKLMLNKPVSFAKRKAMIRAEMRTGNLTPNEANRAMQLVLAEEKRSKLPMKTDGSAQPDYANERYADVKETH
jgi:hypothetical protein